MLDDLVFTRPLLLKQAAPLLSDFQDYLRQTGGGIRPDCPFLAKLVISENTMHDQNLPPSTINIGKNSFTAKAINYDWSSRPDNVLQTVTGEFDRLVAKDYGEALVGETHISEVFGSFTTRDNITRSIHYEKLIKLVTIHGVQLTAALMVQKTPIVYERGLLH